MKQQPGRFLNIKSLLVSLVALYERENLYTLMLLSRAINHRNLQLVSKLPETSRQTSTLKERDIPRQFQTNS